MAAIASGLAQHGWRVLRFEFAYMARQRILERRQGPDRMPVLQEALRQQVQLERQLNPNLPLFVGGKSMGGRVASLLLDELAASNGVKGCLCFGFPFHPPGKPAISRAIPWLAFSLLGQCQLAGAVSGLFIPPASIASS